MTEQSALHSKYRPATLDEVVGHEKVVTALKGIVKSGKWPSAIAFFGPTSAGKTTLAHALVTTALGSPCTSHRDFFEANLSDAKTIEDVRGMVSVSRLRPTAGKRRFLFADEAQGILSNAQAAAAWLKAVESPPASTTWILGSMDPGKFETSANGKALANRCTQFVLSPPDDDSLHKQARRIMKGEGIDYITKEQRTILVNSCNREMRTLANLIQSAQAYYEGLSKKPETLSDKDFQSVLQSAESDDAKTAVRFLVSLYAGKFTSAQRELLSMQDGFSFVNTLMNINWFLLNDAILKGERHPQVWGSAAATAAKVALKAVLGDVKPAEQIERYGMVQAALTRLKIQVQTFAVKEIMTLSQFAYEITQQIKAAKKAAGE